MAHATPMQMCPMAESCKGMMEKPLAGTVLMIPRITFVIVGVLIIIWPAILPWLVAAACIMSGIAMLMMATFMRRISSRFKQAHKQG